MWVDVALPLPLENLFTYKVPEKFLKHLTGTGGLYEIRIEYQSNIYRIFCCFDKGKLVVLFNGFQKILLGN